VTDLQRVQDSLRRFGFAETAQPPTTEDEGGIVLTIPYEIALAEGRGDGLADEIVGGIWKPGARTVLVFDMDGALLADRCRINEAVRAA
jgi:hypothetical protein